jgi:hypothetical protein
MGVRRPPTAAHRPAPARTAQVSGRPPWEPAPRPDSELPWAQAPVPPGGGTGSLPKPGQTRPALPSWDALAEDVWPGGPQDAALHPSVSSPADRNLGGSAAQGSTAAAPAVGARPPGQLVSAAGLVRPQPDSPEPPQPDSPERARPAEKRPGHKRSLDDVLKPYRAAPSEPAPAADSTSQPGAGSGFSPASPPADSGASPPDSTAASPPTGAAASMPDSAVANASADASASEPAVPLPRRLSAPPLRPPSPFPPSQPGTGSSLFRKTGQPPFPPAPRPATEPGAAGTWRRSPGTGPFPPGPGAPATDVTATEPEPPDTGNAQPGGPRVVDGPAAAIGPSGSGSAFPQAARPSASGSRPASGVPPWEITDSPLAVPPASAETEQAGPGPKTPGPLGGLPGAGTAGAGDSTESFPAVDPAAGQRSFPRAGRRGGNENYPAPRPRTDEDAFRLFPPVRRTGNQPPAPPATDDQD